MQTPSQNFPALITSPGNPKIKQARALRQRKQRDGTGLFLVEGLFHIGEALAAHAAIESIFYAPDLLDNDFGRGLIDRAVAEGTSCYKTTGDILASLAEKENPQGIIEFSVGCGDRLSAGPRQRRSYPPHD